MTDPAPPADAPAPERQDDSAAAIASAEPSGEAGRLGDPAVSNPAIHSATVAAEEWPEAFRCLVGGDSGTARRVLERVESGSLRLEAIEASRGESGAFSVVAVAVRNPGRTLGLVLSPLQGPQDRVRASTTIRRVLDSVAGGDAALIQAMFDPSRRLEIAAASDAGLRHLARLRFMEAERTRLVRDELPSPDRVSIATCGQAAPASLASLLARTYERTLDCPGLAGLRRTEDVLEGHRGSGCFDPDLWFSLDLGGVPAGLALLNPNPEAGCTELVYFGLVPEARGRGLGAVLLRHALSRLGPAEPPRVALAVDDRNTPALRLYRRHGFVPGGLRVALVRSLA